jgi:shikimate dehydrogenase
MCNAAFSALGLPHIYAAIDVPAAAQLEPIVSDVRAGLLAGCNVTLPYKGLAYSLSDEQAESAHEAGAANVLLANAQRRVVAHNTDAKALEDELVGVWGDRPKYRAAIIGAGGAGRAAIIACRRLGFKVICITSRSWTSTESMFDAEAGKVARSMGALTAPWPSPNDRAESGRMTKALRIQWSELVANADCVVQATSAGMRGADPGDAITEVVDWNRLPKHAVAFDVVYNPPVTPFLRAATLHGLVAVGGLGMLVRQAALSIELWTGQSPPLDRMRASAEEALGGPAKR